MKKAAKIGLLIAILGIAGAGSFMVLRNFVSADTPNSSQAALESGFARFRVKVFVKGVSMKGVSIDIISSDGSRAVGDITNSSGYKDFGLQPGGKYRIKATVACFGSQEKSVVMERSAPPTGQVWGVDFNFTGQGCATPVAKPVTTTTAAIMNSPFPNGGKTQTPVTSGMPQK